MRCRDAKLCSSGGVRVVLTDFHRSNRTDFLLAGPAFAALAKPGMAQELNRLDALSVEYKRSICCFSLLSLINLKTFFFHQKSEKKRFFVLVVGQFLGNK